MAKPLIAASAIYDEALRILDEEGLRGLHARNLARRLHCSTKTLYRQVGPRERMLRGVVSHALAQTDFDFEAGAHWRATVAAFGQALRRGLLARPELTLLLSPADAKGVERHTARLVHLLREQGLARDQAVEVGRVVVHFTVRMTLADVHARDLEVADVFDQTLAWLVSGIDVAA